jgi:hypothetical protein
MSIAKPAVEELYQRASALAPADRAELAGLLLESIEVVRYYDPAVK